MDILQYGAFATLPAWLITAISVVLILAPVFLGTRLWIVAATWFVTAWTFAVTWWLMILVFAPMAVLMLPPLRRGLISNRILNFFHRLVEIFARARPTG